MKVVAGDAHATQPDTEAVVWRCAPGGGTGFAEPKDCPRDTHVATYVRFPDCWDGQHRDSFDHQSHMAYSNKKTGECPSTHPVHVPRLQLAMGWPTRNGSDIMFSSGPPERMHADFFNAWNRERLEFLVRECWSDGTGRKNHPPIYDLLVSAPVTVRTRPPLALI